MSADLQYPAEGFSYPEYITPLNTPNVLVIERKTSPDDRGFFREAWRATDIKEMTGIDYYPVSIVRVDYSSEDGFVVEGGGNKVLYFWDAEGAFLKLIDKVTGVTEDYVVPPGKRQAIFVPEGITVGIRGDGSLKFLFALDNEL